MIPGRLVGISDLADAVAVDAAVAAGLPILLVRTPDRVDVGRLARLPTVVIVHARVPDAEVAAVTCGFGLHLPGGSDVAAVRRRFAGLLGYSAHTSDEARAAVVDGADYTFLSPVFAPTSKPDDRRHPLGPAALRDVPSVLALGGITPARARVCLDAGAIGVAVLGGIFAAPDPAAAVRAYLGALG